MRRKRGISALTLREREVLERYIALGNQKSVAHALGVAHQTVKNYILNIHTKLDVDSSLQAAVMFDRSLREGGPEIQGRQRRKGAR